MKKKKIVFYLINLLVVILVSFLTIRKIVDQNGAETLSYLANISFFSLLILITMFVVNYYLEGIIIWLSIRKEEPKIRPTEGFIIQSVGGLFSAITPLKSGYMPSVAYAYSKFGAKANSFLKSMAKTSFSYQFVCLLISIVSIVVCSNNKFNVSIGEANLNLQTVAIIGLIYNIVLMIGYFILVLSPRLHNFILKCISCFLYKIKKIENKELYLEEKKQKMTLIREQIKTFFKNSKEFISIVFIYAFKVLFHSSFPYIIFMLLTENSFNLVDFGYSLIFSNLISYITNIIPIPGASGAAEIAFVAVFALIFPSNALTSVMLVWRVFSYFINIIEGFIVFVITLNIKKKDKTIIQ